MQFGISIPQAYDHGEFEASPFREYCQAVEQLGYDGLWAREPVLSAMPALSALESMAYAAAYTERVRIGCAVFVTTLRSPVELATSIATLDQMTGGRIEIGVGTGGKSRPFGAFGMTGDRYLDRFSEGLTLMKELWTQERVTHHGDFWTLDDAALEPKPIQSPHPPIWFGGSGEQTLRRAARLSDGFIGAGSQPTSAFLAQVALVRAALADVGRDSETFPLAKRVYITVDDDADRARARAEAGLLRIYGRISPALSEAVIAGTPEQCATAVREVIAAGAGLVLFNTLDDPIEQAGRLAHDVIPRTR